MRDNISNLKELEELYKSWPTDDLVRATTVDQKDYNQDAINMMRNELGRREISPQNINSAQTSFKNTIGEEKQSLVGIKGFLLLFCVMVGFGSLCEIIAGISALINDNTIPIIHLLSLISGFIGVYGLYTTFLLGMRKTTAPFHAKRLIIVNGTVGFVFGLLIFLRYNELSIGLFGLFMGSTIWLEYLSRSKRVAATYAAEYGNGESPHVDQETQDYCAKCGSPISKGNKLCPNCAQALAS